MTKSLFTYLPYGQNASNDQDRLRRRIQHVEAEILADTTGNIPHPLLEDLNNKAVQDNKYPELLQPQVDAFKQCKLAVDINDHTEALKQLQLIYFWMGRNIYLDELATIPEQVIV